MRLILVEDNADGLYPFSILHCAWELRCGPRRFVDEWNSLLQPSSIEFIGRSHHLASFFARFPEYSAPASSDNRVVAIASSVLPTKALSRQIQAVGNEATMLYSSGKLCAVSCTAEQWSEVAAVFFESQATVPTSFAHHELPIIRIEYIWQALDAIDTCIRDFSPFQKQQADPIVLRDAGIFTLEASNIFLSDDVSIAPLVVLDASNGPVIIEERVRIMPHATLSGPCFVGHDSVIKTGAKIYANTVIGEWSKIGGEVEHSIIHAYSNKQHEGFLGHSILGEWVNLGADTNTSDLKNTYGNIRVRHDNIERDTGRMFLGLVCGDHSKSGINTMFGTGCICGIHSNIFGAGYTPNQILSFSWGAVGEARLYPLKKALSVARTVMLRRNKDLLPQEEVLMQMEFERIHS